MLEQSVAVEDGGHQPEPVTAAARPVVLGQCLAPVARARLREQAGLEGRVAVALELRQQRRQRAVGQDHVRVDQRDQRRRRGPGADRSRGRQAPPFVAQDLVRVSPRDLERAVGRQAVDDDDRGGSLRDHRGETVVEDLRRVPDGDHDRDARQERGPAAIGGLSGRSASDRSSVGRAHGVNLAIIASSFSNTTRNAPVPSRVWRKASHSPGLAPRIIST